MAQKVTVSGVVMDGSLNEPMTGASVVLLQPKDSAQSAGISTDLEGRFKLPAVKAGNYIMRISYMGFQTYYRNIVLPKNNKSINLGTITLQENSKMMKEAEVTARVAQVEMKADTFVFNADAYRMPEGSMLEELVKKLPGAEIDDEGNIKINGKSVSKIMVDGKEYCGNLFMQYDMQESDSRSVVELADRLKDESVAAVAAFMRTHRKQDERRLLKK